MPRIRTIKPDFWDSPDTARADLRIRLLYVAMWNWADDYGIGDASPVRLIAFAFPNDNIPASDYPRLLADVSSAYGVVFFGHAGRRYYIIPEWERHQRTEKKAKLNEELMAAAKSAITAAQTAKANHPQDSAEIPTLTVEDSGAGSGKWEVGKGTEEPPYPPDDEPPPDRLPARQTGSEKARARFAAIQTTDSSLAREIARTYSDSLQTPLSAKLLKEVGEEIDACLRDQIPPDAIAAGIEAWTASDSWSPTQIPNFVHKANNRRPRNGKPTEKALGYDQAAQQLLATLEAS